MKKLLFGVLWVILLLGLIGCGSNKPKLISNEIIDELMKTEKIVVQGYDEEGEITDIKIILNEKEIKEVINIISRASEEKGAVGLEGNSWYLLMCDEENRIIYTILVWQSNHIGISSKEYKINSNDKEKLMEMIEVARIGEKSKYIVSDDLVSLRVKEESLTNSEMTLILENHTDKTYEYGNGYSIEKEESGIWYELKPIRDFAFTLPAYVLKAKESIEIEIDLKYSYGELYPGKYRVIKHVSLSLDRPLKPSDYIYVGAEFIIK